MQHSICETQDIVSHSAQVCQLRDEHDTTTGKDSAVTERPHDARRCVKFVKLLVTSIIQQITLQKLNLKCE